MDNYLGEIRLFAGTRVPQQWHACDGTELQISQYQALYSLLGTRFGGDGTSTFALPDLRGRVPIGQGSGPGLTPRTLGQSGGSTTVTLVPANLPLHTHAVYAGTTTATLTSPMNAVPAAPPATSTGTQVFYAPPVAGVDPTAFDPDVIGNAVAGGVAHSNMMWSTGLNYIIALQGTYPQQSN